MAVLPEPGVPVSMYRFGFMLDLIREQNLESRAKKCALYKDPHLRSSPFQGEGKSGEPTMGDTAGQISSSLSGRSLRAYDMRIAAKAE